LDTQTEADAITAEETPQKGGRRRWILVTGTLVVAIATVVAVNLINRPPEPVLVSDGQGRISLIDLETGEPAYTVTDAVRAPASSTIVRASEESDTTAVEIVDPDSGEVVASTQVQGNLEIRAVSPFGGVVALMPHRQVTADLYVPEPREETTITVAWSDGGEPRTYTLDGNFEPETFSTDETYLFLLEFFPAMRPDRYFVKQLDLVSGEVSDVETADLELGIELNPEMRGHARAQVMSPDGKYLFSLYTIGAGEDPVHAPEDPETDRWAFIHTLNLDEKWSHCIFLPLPFGTGLESTMSVGIAADGKSLFVVDASTESVARVDARDLRVDAVEQIPGLRSSLALPVAVGPEIVYIGLGDSVLEMGRKTLIPNAAFFVNTPTTNLPIVGLELAPDGRTLRVAHGSSISVIDMPTEEIIATLTTPGDGESFVGSPVGDRLDLDLEWVIPGS
jgi:DNA-binding beta-propeller fold protein YncE